MNKTFLVLFGLVLNVSLCFAIHERALCAAMTCPDSHPHCVQEWKFAVCVDNCTKLCPGGWGCSFEKEFAVKCHSPCESTQCAPGFQCIPRGKYARCKPIYSCSKLACAAGSLCQARSDCNRPHYLCPKECAPCMCTQEYEPVCGVDGKTYPNACEASCAQVDVDRLGSCEDDSEDVASCICPLEYKPVCGKDGKVYSNSCFAKCEGINFTPCTNTSGPVCGKDGKTYETYCHATCAAVNIIRPGKCEDDDCVCTEKYEPVCGSDGKTYANKCKAKCAGVEIAKNASC